MVLVMSKPDAQVRSLVANATVFVPVANNVERKDGHWTHLAIEVVSMAPCCSFSCHAGLGLIESPIDFASEGVSALTILDARAWFLCHCAFCH